jgi:branched-subunit amino acid transport protein AzlD
MEGVDTTSAGYQIGHQIGSWLPFAVLAVLFIIMLRTVLRKQQDTPKI